MCVLVYVTVSLSFWRVKASLVHLYLSKLPVSWRTTVLNEAYIHYNIAHLQLSTWYLTFFNSCQQPRESIANIFMQLIDKTNNAKSMYIESQTVNDVIRVCRESKLCIALTRFLTQITQTLLLRLWRHSLTTAMPRYQCVCQVLPDVTSQWLFNKPVEYPQIATIPKCCYHP